MKLFREDSLKQQWKQNLTEGSGSDRTALLPRLQRENPVIKPPSCCRRNTEASWSHSDPNESLWNESMFQQTPEGSGFGLSFTHLHFLFYFERVSLPLLQSVLVGPSCTSSWFCVEFVLLDWAEDRRPRDGQDDPWGAPWRKDDLWPLRVSWSQTHWQQSPNDSSVNEDNERRSLKITVNIITITRLNDRKFLRFRAAEVAVLFSALP